MPIQCEYYALEGLGQLLRNVELVRGESQPNARMSTAIVFDHVRRGAPSSADQVVAEVKSHFGSAVCNTVIPRIRADIRGPIASGSP